MSPSHEEIDEEEEEDGSDGRRNSIVLCGEICLMSSSRSKSRAAKDNFKSRKLFTREACEIFVNGHNKTAFGVLRKSRLK